MTNDTLPYDDELNYLYDRQRKTEHILVLMTLLHLIYFIRRVRHDHHAS
jgi:hypothetical protein